MAKVTVTGGWADPDGAHLQAVFGPALEAGTALVAVGVAADAPYLSGDLAHSFLATDAVEPTAWTDATTLGSGIDSSIPYAHSQETATRNAGYAERGIADAAPGVPAEMNTTLERNVGLLWENGK